MDIYYSCCETCEYLYHCFGNDEGYKIINHDTSCNGREYPNIETFDVDEVYEIIDRVYENVPEDEGVN